MARTTLKTQPQIKILPPAYIFNLNKIPKTTKFSSKKRISLFDGHRVQENGNRRTFNEHLHWRYREWYKIDGNQAVNVLITMHSMPSRLERKNQQSSSLHIIFLTAKLQWMMTRADCLLLALTSWLRASLILLVKLFEICRKILNTALTGHLSVTRITFFWVGATYHHLYLIIFHPFWNFPTCEYVSRWCKMDGNQTTFGSIFHWNDLIWTNSNHFIFVGCSMHIPPSRGSRKGWCDCTANYYHNTTRSSTRCFSFRSIAFPSGLSEKKNVAYARCHRIFLSHSVRLVSARTQLHLHFLVDSCRIYCFYVIFIDRITCECSICSSSAELSNAIIIIVADIVYPFRRIYYFQTANFIAAPILND